MEKLMTISIAAYNVEKYLEKTLQSCLVKQELWSALEVLIVNDGSTDNTLNVARKYERMYPEVYRVIDKKNGGYGSTINAALKIARGKYFRILDGDDWVDTKVLEDMLCILKNFKEDVIFTNSNHVYMEEDKVIKTKINTYGSEKTDKDLVWNDVSGLKWSMHNMTVRTDLLVNNKVEIQEHCFYTDGEFVFFVMMYMDNFRCLNRTFYQHRLGRVGQSVSREGRVKHKEDYLKVLDKELEFFEKTKFINSIKKEYIFQHIVNTAVGVVEYYLLCPCNKTNRNIVKKLDLDIKKKNDEVYKKMNEKKAIAILRFFNYYSYRICQWNELRKISRLENV